MSIAFDAKSSGNSVTPQTSLTVAHTCTGSNLVLFVGVGADSTAGPTGVTYNGVALTKVDEHLNFALSSWYLVAPTTGTHDIVITFAASHYIAGGGISLTGVDPGTPIDNHTIAHVASAGTISGSFNTNYANSFMCDVSLYNAADANYSFGAGETNRWTELVVADGYTLFSNTKPTTAVGSYSMTTSWTTGNNQSDLAIIAFKSFDVGGGSSRKALLGVGI